MNKQLHNRYNLLFAFPLIYGSTPAELYKAFKRIEYLETKNLFSEEYICRLDEYWARPTLYQRIYRRIMRELKISPDTYKINRKLTDYLADYPVDIIFFVQAGEVRPSTLKMIKRINPKIKLIMWTQDDMFAKHNRSLFFNLSLKYYDLVITQRTCNIDELTHLGAKKVLRQFKAFQETYINQLKLVLNFHITMM